MTRQPMVGAFAVYASLIFWSPAVVGQAPRERAAPSAESHGGLVTVSGTSLRLGTLLNQLTRQQGLRLVVQPEVDLSREVDLPTLRDVVFEDAMRVILTPLGYSFELESGELGIYARHTRSFRVRMPMITQSWTSSISNEANVGGVGQQAGASGGDGGGGATPSGSGTALGARVSLLSQTSSEGLWNELEATLKTLTSKDGTFAVNRTAGMLTVTDMPAVLDAVGKYVATLNRELGRQLVIEVRIAEVSLRDRRQWGVDWSQALDRLGSLGFAGVRAQTTSSLGLDAFKDTGAFSLRFSGVAGKAVLRALEDQGEVNVKSQPNLLVGNGQPAIIQSGNVKAYVASITQTQIQDAGISTTAQVGVVSDGVVLALVPRMHEDASVSLAVSIVLQDLRDPMERVVFEGGLLDLPELTRRTYTGVVSAKPGETVVIAGLLEDETRDERKGVPWLVKAPIVGPLFGVGDKLKRRSELVITLTPRSAEPMPAGKNSHD